MIIKLLLITATLAIAWYALRHGGRSHQQAVRRLLGCLVALLGVVAVIWPEAVTWAANLVGVGRGTDLVLYLAVVVFAFVATSLYGRVHDLEHQLVVVVRELAIAQQSGSVTPHLVPEDQVG